MSKNFYNDHDRMFRELHPSIRLMVFAVLKENAKQTTLESRNCFRDGETATGTVLREMARATELAVEILESIGEDNDDAA